MDQFHIWFEKSGGFTGISRSIEIISDSIPAQERKTLEMLIEQSRFFSDKTPEQLSDNSTLPDQLYYKITIERKNQKKTVTCSQSNISQHLKPLLDYLNQQLRTRR